MVKPQCLKRKNVAFLCICPISEGLRLPKTIFGVGPIFYHLQLSRQERVVSAPLTSQSSHVFHFVACPQVDARQTRAPNLKPRYHYEMRNRGCNRGWQAISRCHRGGRLLEYRRQARGRRRRRRSWAGRKRTRSWRKWKRSWKG